MKKINRVEILLRCFDVKRKIVGAPEAIEERITVSRFYLNILAVCSILAVGSQEQVKEVLLGYAGDRINRYEDLSADEIEVKKISLVCWEIEKFSRATGAQELTPDAVVLLTVAISTIFRAIANGDGGWVDFLETVILGLVEPEYTGSYEFILKHIATNLPKDSLSMPLSFASITVYIANPDIKKADKELMFSASDAIKPTSDKCH